MTFAQNTLSQSLTDPEGDRAGDADAARHDVVSDQAAALAATGASMYQTMLQDRLAHASSKVRYPPAARAAIILGGGLLAWGLVLAVARLVAVGLS
jgi:hypothetical protein